MTLTNAEVVARFKPISDMVMKADAGTTTTLSNSVLIEEPDLTNKYVCFISGENYGQDRIINFFYEDSGKIEFDALQNAVTNVDEVAILSNGFLSDIKQAEVFMTNHLRNKGLDISLFLNVLQLKEAHIFKTLEIICQSYMKDAIDTDIFYVASEKFRVLYETELNTLVADYDSNESGSIDSDEEDLKIGQVRFAR